jgi:glucose/arabinose dehydrogenase
MNRHANWVVLVRALILCSLSTFLLAQNSGSPFYDFHSESPGTAHKIPLSDLPKPNATKSAVNPPEMAPKPANAIPKTLPGFKVNLYTSGLDEPRKLLAAPNGDIFLAESNKGEITIVRGVSRDGTVEQTSTFATGLHRPFESRVGLCREYRLG